VSVSTKRAAPGVAVPWGGNDDADERSFPPVADLGVRGRGPEEDAFDDGEHHAAVERRRALMSPNARQRRARFAKYVAGAVGASVVLCAAALVKTSLARGPGEHGWSEGTARPAQATHVVGAAPKAEPASPTPPAGPLVTPSAEPAPPTLPMVAPPVVEPQPSAPAMAVEPQAASTSAPAATLAGASKERESSRFALERGDLGTAIAAGERSVALDPSDGEAWLVLGAAYQARGEIGQAKRCYKACLEEGKRGPKGECRAMALGQ
jgi:type IV secretory pathway VirB10-like protein